MLKKNELLQFSRDRLAMVLMACLFLCVLALTILTAFNVHVSDVQVPNRYSAYGFTNLYRDKWYALLAFALFGVIVFVTNGYLAVKLHEHRRGIALGLLAGSIAMLIFALIIASAVFRLAAFSL
jgi:hypothetical protein